MSSAAKLGAGATLNWPDTTGVIWAKDLVSLEPMTWPKQQKADKVFFVGKINDKVLVLSDAIHKKKKQYFIKNFSYMYLINLILMTK